MPDLGGQYAIQRRWKRFKVELRLKVSLRRDSGNEIVFSQGSDISEGGLAAYIPAELDLRETVDIELKLPYTKEAIHFTAVVCNRNGFRYGLETINLDSQAREQLLRSLKALSHIQH